MVPKVLIFCQDDQIDTVRDVLGFEVTNNSPSKTYPLFHTIRGWFMKFITQSSAAMC